MVVVKLIGGLGNQMFQYAAGRALAEHHHTELFLDTSYLMLDPDGAYTIRKFELDKFKIEAEFAGKKELDHFNFKASRYITKFKSFFPGLFKSILFNESQSFFHKQFFKLPKTTYLNGYWQDEQYFSKLRGALQKEFDLKEKSDSYQNFVKQVQEVNSVSVHVRHGDYLTLGAANKFHGVLPLTYYLDAVKYFSGLNEDFTFFIFSDDLNWCKENLGFIKNANFVEGKKLNLSSQEELLIMSQCKHNIIANSSFSWWAGWLNANENKKITAPKHWLNKTQEQPAELIPSNWIRL